MSTLQQDLNPSVAIRLLSGLCHQRRKIGGGKEIRAEKKKAGLMATLKQRSEEKR